ncbi:glucose PTS transporter subunit IIA [Dermatophilus congolensis]|uniref:EIICBA-Glc n=1 Tax=Dermatophilus congolensis TaxID=1863 RepID=A0A239V708_9MICO|nr:glucose PTS transporter subunit IIA [Dermatophilus congolensis]MBO3130359.1 PTS transporter subunit EIIC [Dermatophilus congolensis]MBO3131010.1 PTS transporter subunit EIIC [Dermatophilus congolensis]MBO3134830.1 PTS transporter subunit EIIC [Dermatophilus congolensis]MBO3137067.1 PTS transporter subunit EIIC [Dermatophilus congolensis]MBO3139311.1 PTS transporter subunit EIIC [Dermatophilus congolensis]
MSTTTDTAPSRAPRKGRFSGLQRFAKSLMLPIALLPAAGLLLRFGQEDVLGWIETPVVSPFFDAMTAAGDSIFKQLAILFAVGIAIGMAKKADGSTALAAVAGYIVIESVFKAMSPVVLAGKVDIAGEPLTINYGVLGGIVVGLITAKLFDRFHDIELPTYLGFFGGRRFVPIVVSFTVLIVGFAMSYCYPLFNAGLTTLATGIASAGAVGAFLYGLFNRLLIPFGLHHIINIYIWFQYGSFATPDGALHGELTRFASGDPTAGILTSGFYPILMFGLPGAALAMMHCARPNQKKFAAGIFGAAGLTAFLTGITEPLEFAFMFAAFPLYVLHAILTGLSLAAAYTLDIHLGFSFSAGLIDLLLYGNSKAAHNIPLLVGLGVGFFVLYYVVFRFAITAWNLRTPGREDTTSGDSEKEEQNSASTDRNEMATQLVEAFGGRENLLYVDACITRLRIEVENTSLVNKERLRELGAAGVLEVGNNIQAVFGPRAESLKHDMRQVLTGEETPVSEKENTSSHDAAPSNKKSDATPDSGEKDTATDELIIFAPITGRVVPLSEVPDETFSDGLLGNGLAIEPEEKTKIPVTAPVSGELVQMWPHAFVIKTPSGRKILTHLGIETVGLKGKGFTKHANAGDTVEAGQLLIDYDVAAVAKSGRNVVVPVMALETSPEAIAKPATGQVEGADPLYTVR